MTWSYQYTPYVWSVVISIALLTGMWTYGVRHRTAPGAIAFSLLMLGAILWVSLNGLGLLSADDPSRIFWFKCQACLVIPMATAALCFCLEYAGLVKWQTRRTFALLTVVPLIFVTLILTNDSHHLVWKRIWFDGVIQAERGAAHWGIIAYGYLLSLLQLLVLIRLFVKSPRHRWMAAGLILSLLCTRGSSYLNLANMHLLGPLNPMVVVLNPALLPYAIAIVRFRMFGVVPIARDTAIEWMADGFMVLDIENRIADLNRTAEALLGIPRSKVIDRPVAEVLGAHPDLLGFVRGSGTGECEVSLGGCQTRHYQVSRSPIVAMRGFLLGQLISLRDVTEQKRTRAQLLDQERTVAMLRERELLARELHDGIGQLAAAAHMQARCASDLLAGGNAALAGSCLQGLGEAIQEIKKSVRDYLLGIQTRSGAEGGFLEDMRRYVEQYGRKYGIHAELIAPSDLEERRIDSTVETQLQPIIQEALTNVRRHSGARSARVIFTPCDGHIQVTIEDDGQNVFDPRALGEGHGFGLRSMRGRAEALGGRLTIDSTPGKGTMVSIQVPWRKDNA